MDLSRPIRAFDRFQQRRKWLAVPTAVIKKFGDDQGGGLAALVAYYTFFCIFPLLLVFTTILGYVLQGDPDARRSVINTIQDQIPVAGRYIDPGTITGSSTAIVLGLITSLLAGFGVTNAAQNALDRVWAVPFKKRRSFLHARLRGLMLFVSLGILFVVATGATALVSQGPGGIWAVIGGIVVSLALNFSLFLAAFRFMTSAEVSMRDLWVGVAVAAIFWTLLQIGGSAYVAHVLSSSSHYGVFASVIGLLVFLHLGAQLTLYAAEINVVLVRRLWPRSLFGPPQVPADERTLTALAKVEERHDTEEVEVTFHPEPTGPQNS